MTTEMTMLAASAGLLLVLVLIQATIGVQTQGLVPMANARDDLPAPGKIQARALRVVDNHREGLTIFAPIALIAIAQNLHTPFTALGAQLFFYSRLAHAIVYLLGIPMIRPAFWAAGIVGTVMMLLALFGVG